jgi:hypothetical protein
MHKYYIVIDGTQQGPFSAEELKEKGVTSQSLIWTEGMDNWTEAKNIKALNEVIKITPPPIPQQSEKPIKVEAEISKKKEKLITPSTEIAVAKETKANFKMILYALLLGLISYPIFFAIKDGFSNMTMQNKWENFSRGNRNYANATEEEKDLEELKNLKSESRSLGWQESSSIEWQRYNLITQYTTYHERAYKEAAENSIMPSLITALISALVLILGRYVTKGAKWVEETSKKEIQ